MFSSPKTSRKGMLGWSGNTEVPKLSADIRARLVLVEDASG